MKRITILMKKIFFDMALNIFATAIPTFALQLIILPILARSMSDAKYGLLVTILAILNVVPSTMGNVLNNIRLLYNNDYIENGYEGDFNVILLLLTGINLIRYYISGFSVGKYVGFVGPYIDRSGMRPCLSVYHTFHSGTFWCRKITGYDRCSDGFRLCGDLPDAAGIRPDRQSHQRRAFAAVFTVDPGPYDIYA